MTRTISMLLLAVGLALAPALAHAEDGPYLGRYSTNRHDPQSTSNRYGTYGSPYHPQSINNPYGTYGSPYSPRSANNPYATDTPRLYGTNGRYLGKLSKNQFDSESISNPLGTYGNKFSPNSVTNPLGTYGSSLSNQSAANPYATDAPRLYGSSDPARARPSFSVPPPLAYPAPDMSLPGMSTLRRTFGLYRDR